MKSLTRQSKLFLTDSLGLTQTMSSSVLMAKYGLNVSLNLEINKVEISLAPPNLFFFHPLKKAVCFYENNRLRVFRQG